MRSCYRPLPTIFSREHGKSGAMSAHQAVDKAYGSGPRSSPVLVELKTRFALRNYRSRGHRRSVHGHGKNISECYIPLRWKFIQRFRFDRENYRVRWNEMKGIRCIVCVSDTNVNSEWRYRELENFKQFQYIVSRWNFNRLFLRYVLGIHLISKEFVLENFTIYLFGIIIYWKAISQIRRCDNCSII